MTATPEALARAVSGIGGKIDYNHPLPITLSAAVPLWAQKLCPLPADRIFDPRELQRLADALWEAGEAVLYLVPGKTAAGFNALAETVARLAFAPGGVRCFGMHWEYKPGEPWASGAHGRPCGPNIPSEPAPAKTVRVPRRNTRTFKVPNRKGRR